MRILCIDVGEKRIGVAISDEEKIIARGLGTIERGKGEVKKIKEIKVPEVPSEDYFAVYQMYTIRVLEGKDKREGLMEFLKEKGITSRIYFDPIHKYSVFKKILGGTQITLPNTEKLASEVLTLPLYPTMTQNEIDYVIASVGEFFSR